MKWSIKREIIPLIALIALLALILYFYPGLPDVIPSHYNAQGVADGFMPKLAFMLIFGGIVLAIYLLLTFIPRVDPFWKKIQPHMGIFLTMRDFAVLFFVYIFALSLIGAKRGSMPVMAMNVGIGLLFIFMGLWLPKLPRNFFFGIRTPWTLVSDEVWRKSHILGGWLFGVGGVIFVILSLLKVDFVITLLVILVPAVLVSAIIYPLIIYRRLQKDGRLNSPQL